MFQCLRCHRIEFVFVIDRDAGDWIVRCDHCGAKNIVAIAENAQLLFLLNLDGWR
jgi:hypothetical protein